MVHDVSDRSAVVFDDERMVANAGVMLSTLLASRLGIEALIDQHVDLGDTRGRRDSGSQGDDVALVDGARGRLHR